MVKTKSYDNLNRLTQIASTPSADSALSFNYQNNSANQRTAITNADSSRWVYTYDSLGQVVSGKKYWSDSTPVAGQQFEYTFDDIGNRKTTAAGGDQYGANLRWANYGANGLNQYTNRTVPGYVDIVGSATNTATVTANSQPTYRHGDYFRAELTVANSSGAVWLSITNLAVLNNGTSADILASITGKVFLPKTPEAYTYDADGNLTSDGRWTNRWDAENRLIQMESLADAPSNSKRKLTFAYDHRGRRTEAWLFLWNGSAYGLSKKRYFVYDDWNLIAALGHEQALKESFVWGLDASGTLQGAGGVGGLLAMTVHSGANAGTYLYSYDGNHNVAALVNATSGVIAARYEYGPFGEVLRATGPVAFENPFLFSTKFYDWETGFYYYGYRYYDPSTGRWLSRDLIAELGGPNLYGFVGNDPLNFFDAYGMEPMTLAQAVQRGNIRFVELPDITVTPEESRLILSLANRAEEIVTPSQIEKRTMSIWPWMDRINPVSPYTDLRKKYPTATCDDEIFRWQADYLNEYAAKLQLFAWFGDSGDHRRFQILDVVNQLTVMLAMQAVSPLPRTPSQIESSLATTRALTIPVRTIPDEAFVRFDPTKYDASIAELGIQSRFFDQGKVWMTKYGAIKGVNSAAELETILYRQNLWNSTQGKFTQGATLRLVNSVEDAVAAGMTNMRNGVPQWRIVRNIPPSDLEVIRRLK